MSGQCPEKDFRLPDWTKAYGDQRKVTEEMLRSYHRALCYLKDETELIHAKTGPQIRDTLLPPFADDTYSYGHALGSRQGRDAYMFSNDTNASITIDFSDYESVKEYVDERKTTAQIAVEEEKLRLPDYQVTEIKKVVEHEVRTEKKIVEVETQVWDGTRFETKKIPREVEIPVTHRDEYIENVPKTILKPIIGWPETQDISRGSDIAWRPGYKTWCKNHVIIAQTFRVPYDTTIKKLYLALKPPKRSNKPLHVGIAPTDEKYRPKIKIKRFKWPDMDVTGLLERHKIRKEDIGQGNVAVIDFDLPVKKDQLYAIVIWTKSEQSSSNWRVLGIRNKNVIKAGDRIIGRGWMYWNRRTGWEHLSRTIKRRKVKGSICFRIDGVAVIQEPKKVVKEWTEYVRKIVYDEVKVEYPVIKTVLVPKEVEYTYDFYYVRDVPVTLTKYSSGMYLYLKPIKLNPVEYVVLDATDSRPAKTSIEYQIGIPTSGGIDWRTLKPENNYSTTFSRPVKVLLFRAKLITEDDSVTPSIKSLKLSFRTQPASEMLLVSRAFTPPLSGILCANVWAAADSTYEKTPGAQINASIVLNEDVMFSHPVSYHDRYKGDGITRVFQLTYAPVFPGSEVVALNEEEILERDKDYTIDYKLGKLTLTSTPRERDQIDVEYSIRQVDLPVDEILEGSSTISLETPEGKIKQLYEYEDYYEDYKEGKVSFYKPLRGLLQVVYKPILVSNLSHEDETLPARLDTQRWTTRADGETKVFKLPYVPVEPIFLVQIDDEDQVEGVDYFVDYTTGEIIFNVAPSIDSIVEVIYTPNVRCPTLRLALRGNRTSEQEQAYIYDTRFTYRP